MISHGKDMKVFSGNSNVNLAKDICKLIGIQLGNAEISHFARRRGLCLHLRVRARVRRVPGPVHQPSGQRQPDGAAGDDRRHAPGLRRAHHAVIPTSAMPGRTARQGPGPHLRQAGGQHDRGRRADRVLTMDLHAARFRASSTFPWITSTATPSSWTTTPRNSASGARTWWWSPRTWAACPGPDLRPEAPYEPGYRG